jgi:hypothetical protein
MGAGDLLVDQTLVCEAARLLRDSTTDDHYSKLNAERLAQLSLLLDALLLYEQLYVLPSERPRDAGQLELREALLNMGILKELDTADSAATIAEEIARFLAQVDDSASGCRRYRNEGHPTYEEASTLFAAAIQGQSIPELRGTFSRHILANLQGGYEGGFTGTRRLGSIRYRDPDSNTDAVSRMGAALMDLIFSGRSGDVPLAGASHMRTFMYWRASAHLNLPFYPSLRRLPQYYLITNSIGEAVQDAVYGAVAESFKATVSEVYEHDLQLPLYLPPSLSLFLEYLRDGSDISLALQRLRADFKPLRTALARLAEDSRQAATLGELRAIKQRFSQISEDLRSPGQTTTAAAIDQALDIAPRLASALVNPLDVRSYSTALVKTPVEWVRRWWLRRPYRLVFKLKDRLLAVRDYDQLSTQIAALQVRPFELAALYDEYDRYLNRFGTYGPARRPEPLRTDSNQ